MRVFKLIPPWVLVLLFIVFSFVFWTYYTFSAGQDNFIFSQLDLRSMVVSVSDLSAISGLITGFFSAVALGLAVWAIILQKHSIQSDIDQSTLERLEGNIREAIKDFGEKHSIMVKNYASIYALGINCTYKDDVSIRQLAVDQYNYVRQIRNRYRKIQKAAFFESKKNNEPFYKHVNGLSYDMEYEKQLKAASQNLGGSNLFDTVLVRLWLAIEDTKTVLDQYETINVKLIEARDLLASRTSLSENQARESIDKIKTLIREISLLPFFDVNSLEDFNRGSQRIMPVDDDLEEVLINIDSTCHMFYKFFDEKHNGSQDRKSISDQIDANILKIKLRRKSLTKLVWEGSRQHIESVIVLVDSSLNRSEHLTTRRVTDLPYLECAESPRGIAIQNELTEKLSDTSSKSRHFARTLPRPVEDLSYLPSEVTIDEIFQAHDDSFVLFGVDNALLEEFLQTKQRVYEESPTSRSMSFSDYFAEHENEIFTEFAVYVRQWMSENEWEARIALSRWIPSEARLDSSKEGSIPF